MLQVTAQTRILVAVEPVDFRRGIDGLARVCRSVLGSDPFCGALFVFCNRRRTAIKILAFDGQGMWLCHKRLSSGRFRWWPRDGEHGCRSLLAHELFVLLSGGEPHRAGAVPQWRPVLAAS